MPAPITLRDLGSFHVGGREVTLSGRPVRELMLTPGGAPVRLDPNGDYQVEQMYVQWFRPLDERGRYPLLLWHGGGLSGVCYETTPDGREGWLHWFLRQGWTVYNADAVERGRAGWAPSPEVFAGEPVFLPKDNPFERFRIGDGPGSYHADPARRRVLPGNQFPVQAYDDFVRQLVPRWTSTDDAVVAAYIALIERVGPSVVLVHSQAGQFGWRVAQARPDLVRGLVLVEPSGHGDPQALAALRDMPVLCVYGDYIDQDSRWPAIRANHLRFLDRFRDAGGAPEVIDLPAIGIHGNSHMMMMDRNNLQVADVIQRWLQDRGLSRAASAGA